MRIQQADGDFVVGVSGKAIAFPEFRRDCRRKVANKPMHLLLRGFVSGGGVVAGQTGEILAEAMPRSKAIIPRLVQILQRRPTVPPAHVVSRSREAGALAKRL